ncbi:energy transducer TonB [Sunxiuqinia sp. sy24]|uniref:energy transducer TonB n=1 Tax=Sunxiuqinia sp. sy24 TaxID=3461495 RepID=UPI004045B506
MKLMYACYSFTSAMKLLASLLLLFSIPYTASSQEQNEQIWFIASELPSFHYKGGSSLNESFMLYIQDSLRLPAPNCQGKVLVSFVVEKDSTISQVNIRQGLDNCPGYEREVKRLLLTMPQWVPGKNGDEIVRVSMSMPISFQSKP